ncbi:Spermatogenic leucine zipper protein 1 [Sciurus carolinensis]|uniref:Spermatogenic leucine zipper protein 1 n=1 Tax=Sciurus carolinensis TaxID=30640 RepID=A0AA41SVL1_SCICA|nr:spermatogenic leucine zipper protein 1 [Sciurus carolinensis]MBZ3875444.1 Spermatogenic leucine zipper protein 1 [Sciurus carolinensis]
MASSESSAETSTPSQACDPTPTLHEQILNSGITIALFEIGSLPSSCWGSPPSLIKDSQILTGPQTAQTFENLIRELGDILNIVTGFEEKITEAKETSEETIISEDVLELTEKIREFGKTNKTLLKNLLINSVPEEEQKAKKQEVVCENQSPKNKVQVSVRDLADCSEEKRVLNETQPSEEEGKYVSPHAQEENIKLLNNMEKLLQEAEHWSKQHSELHGLIQSYQKSQKDRRDSLKINQAILKTEPNNQVSIKNELEEQVKKLNHDTYSLHLIAALLDNECQILQKRVELLKELHQHQEESPLEKLNQIYPKQIMKKRKTWELEQVETNKENKQETGGIVQKKIGVSRSLDVCLNKKARNNQLNNHIARGLRKKRPASSLR